MIGAFTVWLRAFRARHPDPKYLPTSFLKKKWINWRVPTYSSRGSYQTANRHDRTPGRYDPGIVIHIEHGGTDIVTTESIRPSNNNSGETTVDRNTSVRSVITLPAYRTEATEHERVLGREGERDGIDVVLEMRTAEEEEDLRNAEMEQLFQIRQHRRTRNQQREARRERRQQARQNGDIAELELLREEARQARDDTELNELRQVLEDIQGERDRHTSMVSYADLGVARHDGTRVRTGSVGDGGSENIGLLSDAESIAQISPRLGRDSRRASSLLAWPHRRGRSSGSIDTTGELPSPSLVNTQSRAGSIGTMESVRVSTMRDTSPGLSASIAGFASQRESSVTLATGRQASAVYEVDLGDERIPPPGYEDVELEDERRSASMSAIRMTPSSAGSDEPPPGYVSRGNSLRNSAGESGSEGLGIQCDGDRTGAEHDERYGTRQSEGISRIPQLPSLRLARLPQIVVEQTSRPGSSQGGPL